MVLQRAPLSANVWGFGEEGQKVEVTLTNAQHEVQQTFDTTVKKGRFWYRTLLCLIVGGKFKLQFWKKSPKKFYVVILQFYDFLSKN